MRVDFYLMAQGEAMDALPPLAAAAMKAGQRMLVVAGDGGARGRISDALWGYRPTAFLAHGEAGGPQDEAQPILIAPDMMKPANGARIVLLADGEWREVEEGFDRALLLFGEATRAAARAVWSMLGQREGVERHFHEYVDGRWVARG
ncbi:MAG: DNA polymerase III subunit chi [Sphingomonadales bacterium]|nr:DNA polymerase III subunit chi [Sphingomonadales bacterium]MDE2168930.1 DNA polymerase III subunit chi [Sphingomonadales bacterium]